MAVSRLRRAEQEEAEQSRNVLEEVRRLCKLQGLRWSARQAGIDPANPVRVLKDRTKPSPLMMAKLQALLAEKP
jgi:hypothetical protein